MGKNAMMTKAAKASLNTAADAFATELSSSGEEGRSARRRMRPPGA